MGRESQLSIYICVMLFPFPQAGLREGWSPGEWQGARRGGESLVDIFVTLVLFLLVLNPYRPGPTAVHPGEVAGHSPEELIIMGVC